MEKINFRICTENDIESLMKTGEQTFRETFENENTEEDMNNYCKENFNYDKISEEINDKNSKYFVAEVEIGNTKKVAGYMKVNFFGSQTEENYENSLELQRIYVLKAYKNQGIGKTFMENAIKLAKENNLEYVWLGVWEHNYKAIEFYKNKGFEKFGEHIFILGDDKQIDYLMKLNL